MHAYLTCIVLHIRTHVTVCYIYPSMGFKRQRCISGPPSQARLFHIHQRQQRRRLIQDCIRVLQENTTRTHNLSRGVKAASQAPSHPGRGQKTEHSQSMFFKWNLSFKLEKHCSAIINGKEFGVRMCGLMCVQCRC